MQLRRSTAGPSIALRGVRAGGIEAPLSRDLFWNLDVHSASLSVVECFDRVCPWRVPRTIACGCRPGCTWGVRGAGGTTCVCRAVDGSPLPLPSVA